MRKRNSLAGHVRKNFSNMAGFTLIELTMTIVVASIVSIPLSVMVGQHIASTIQSADLTTALDVARADVETVNNLAYANIISANYNTYNLSVTRTVTYAAGTSTSAESLKKIVVDVRKVGGASSLVNLITYLAKNVIVGQ